MMHKSKIDILQPEPQLNSELKADALSSAKLLPNPMLAEAFSVKPMLFSTPMVKAILDGKKTITRRQKGLTQIDLKATEIIPNKGWPKQGNFTARFQFNNIENDGVDAWEVTNILKSPFKIGDIIWVRETFRSIEQDFGKPRYEYKATEKINKTDKWKPSLFMPKDACRLFLKVTEIRVEKLHDISEQDAMNEGSDISDKYMTMVERCNNYSNPSGGKKGYSHKAGFEELWNKINKNWDDNPWVWVISFKRAGCPQGFC